MANLFSLANQIRKAAGYNNMTQAEAIALAKKKMSEKPAPLFKVGEIVKTVGGQDAKICCFTAQGKMFVHVFSRVGSYMDRDLHYNMDGTCPFASEINGLRLIPNAA